MKREFGDYLEDIVDAMADAESFVAGMSYDEFENDRKTVFAVVRALEIIGEAVKKVPEHVRGRKEDIPWQEMAGMRDKLIHEYFGVRLDVVWATVTEEIPGLKPLFAVLLREYGQQ